MRRLLVKPLLQRGGDFVNAIAAGSYQKGQSIISELFFSHIVKINLCIIK